MKMVLVLPYLTVLSVPHSLSSSLSQWTCVGFSSYRINRKQFSHQIFWTSFWARSYFASHFLNKTKGWAKINWFTQYHSVNQGQRESECIPLDVRFFHPFTHLTTHQILTAYNLPGHVLGPWETEVRKSNTTLFSWNLQYWSHDG